MIGYCPKCGSCGQMNDVCHICGERYTHQNITEADQARISKYLKLYAPQSDDNVVIKTKNTTKVIITVATALCLISVFTVLLISKEEPKMPRIVSSERQTSAPIQPLKVKETPVVKEMPVVPRPRIEETRTYQVTNHDTNKTDWEPTSPSEAPRPITKADITAAMRSVGAQIRTCARASSVKGTMKVSFVITKKGNVQNYKNLSPEFANQPVATCVGRVISNLKFHKPNEDTPVNNYPVQIQ